MPFTTNYKRGDIVLVSFPFTDFSSTKRRPALVISPDTFNSQRQDLVMVAITSHITDDPDGVFLAPDDFAEGILPKPSAVKIAKIFTIHSSLVVKKIGRLKGERLSEVLLAIRRFFS